MDWDNLATGGVAALLTHLFQLRRQQRLDAAAAKAGDATIDLASRSMAVEERKQKVEEWEEIIKDARASEERARKDSQKAWDNALQLRNEFEHHLETCAANRAQAAHDLGELRHQWGEEVAGLRLELAKCRADHKEVLERLDELSEWNKELRDRSMRGETDRMVAIADAVEDVRKSDARETKNSDSGLG